MSAANELIKSLLAVLAISASVALQPAFLAYMPGEGLPFLQGYAMLLAAIAIPFLLTIIPFRLIATRKNWKGTEHYARAGVIAGFIWGALLSPVFNYGTIYPIYKVSLIMSGVLLCGLTGALLGYLCIFFYCLIIVNENRRIKILISVFLTATFIFSAPYVLELILAEAP